MFLETTTKIALTSVICGIYTSLIYDDNVLHDVVWKCKQLRIIKRVDILNWFKWKGKGGSS